MSERLLSKRKRERGKRER
jgi:hypothetical protein